jgi:hypothetical protein
LSAWEPHKIDLYYDRPRPALCLSSSEPPRRLPCPMDPLRPLSLPHSLSGGSLLPCLARSRLGSHAAWPATRDAG